MCGIVGYVGKQSARLADELIEALVPLEYRGYDSAGVAVLGAEGLAVVKAVGGLDALREKARGRRLAGGMGMAHTRWATHGAPDEAHAHPHVTPDGRLALILNGIVENDAALRRELGVAGVRFATGNDGETLLRWIEAHLTPGVELARGVQQALAHVEGNYAVCILHVEHPDVLVAAKRHSPLAVARGARGAYVASDAAALGDAVDEIYHLIDGDVLALRAGDAEILGSGRQTSAPAWVARPALRETPHRAGFETFTLKEIHEQPEAVARSVDAALAAAPLPAGLVAGLDRVVLAACGSAWHAAAVGAQLIERMARVPAVAMIASELRTADPVLTERTLVVAVSQSGETADTLACVKQAKAAGAFTLAVCNVDGSAIVREADAKRLLACGPEVGVASTKAYTAMLVQVAFLALELARARAVASEALVAEHVAAARELPGLLSRGLLAAPRIAALAAELATHQSFVFIGRGLAHAGACEGALKLRELTYVNAEGYAAGELKHGSIALIGPGHPVLAVAPRASTTPKILGNVQEVKARGAFVVGIVTEGDSETAALCDRALAIPATAAAFVPVLTALPLQLFAYEMAKRLGRNVDRPRNLAKSVTVE
jgi:glucosamine--fructose-6-phosphate aminotransferase (isomerizing)